VSVKVLSRVINESLGQSFFYFVNTYRVEEAKQLLTNARDPKITVPEVMDQAASTPNLRPTPPSRKSPSPRPAIT
jgi:AraC-like DNA-binding protein